MSPDSRERALFAGGFFALVALIVGAMSLARLLGYEPPRGSPSPLVDQEAPDFDLPLLGGPERVHLLSLRGEVVLLDFWASWCGPCRRSIPVLNRVHERYGGRIRMYGVNVEQGVPEADLQRAHQSFGARFPSLMDPRGAAQVAYRISSIPTLVLIGRSGRVRAVFLGVPDPDEVGGALEGLLRAGRAPPASGRSPRDR